MTYFSVEHRDPEMEKFERKIHGVLPHHFGRFLEGEPLNIYEQVSDHIHLHLFIWAPTAQRPVWTVVTAGMSAHRMNVPEELSDYARAELVMTLPADWPSIEEIQEMPYDRASIYQWPFEEMTTLARIPYLNNTWLGHGHTVRSADAIDDTYAGSEFSGILVDSVSSLPPEAMRLDVDGMPVHCLGVYPLYAQELQDIVDRQLSGHEWFHRCVDAGLHEGLLVGRPLLV